MNLSMFTMRCMEGWVRGIYSRTGRILLAIIPLLFLVVLPGDGMGEDRTAGSCSAADIQSAINSCISSGGGTVYIPACDSVESWGTGDKIYVDTNVPFRIKGAGSTSTKIGYNNGGSPSGMMWAFWGAGFEELSGMYLEGNYTVSPSLGFIKIGSKGGAQGPQNAIIHDIVTKNFSSRSQICHTKNLVVFNNVFNQILNGNQYHFDLYDIASTPWGGDGITYPNAFGTTNVTAFFENNVFYGAHHITSTFTRARVVIRYNSIIINNEQISGDNQGNFDAHEPGYGTCGDDSITDANSYYHGGQAYEIYNNHFTRQTRAGYGIRLRSGSAIITNNTFDNWSYGIEIKLDSNSVGGQCTAAYGYPQDHSIARGKGACTASDGCCDKPENFFVWNNSFTNVNYDVNVSSNAPGGGGLVEEQDYFLRAPSQSIDGFTWTPYSYPHPIRSGIAELQYPKVPTNLAISN